MTIKFWRIVFSIYNFSFWKTRSTTCTECISFHVCRCIQPGWTICVFHIQILISKNKKHKNILTVSKHFHLISMKLEHSAIKLHLVANASLKVGMHRFDLWIRMHEVVQEKNEIIFSGARCDFLQNSYMHTVENVIFACNFKFGFVLGV